MSIDIFRRKLARSNQEVNNLRNYFQDLIKRVTDLTNPKALTFFMLRGPVTSVDTSSRNSNVYPERFFADCLKKYGDRFIECKCLGNALHATSDAFYKFSEARSKASCETHAELLDPTLKQLEGELKEVLNSCKKTTDYRRTYDSHRRSAGLAQSRASAEDLVQDEEKLRISMIKSYNGMSTFLEHEPDQIEHLCNFIKSQLSLYQDAVNIMSDLQAKLSTIKMHAEKRKEANQELQKPDDINNSYGQPAISTCVAVYDFQKLSTFDLELRVGDEVQILEQIDKNWYFGCSGQDEGLFPVTYVKLLGSPPDSNPNR